MNHESMSSRSLRILLERLCEVLFLIGGVLKGIGPWVHGKITGAKQQILMYIRYSPARQIGKARQYYNLQSYLFITSVFEVIA